MIDWYYLVVASLVLLLFLLYKEWTRKSRANLYGRLIASLLAVTGLLGMGCPFSGKSKMTPTKIIVLTDGYIKDSLDQFLRQARTGVAVFSVAPGQPYSISGNPVQPAADWPAFAQKSATDTIHVFGTGLSNEALSLLDSQPIIFHASPVSAVISHVYWKQNIQPGAPLIVQGHYENNTGREIKILLQAFGAVKDTASVAAFASQDFVLRTIPVHRGRAVYTLMALSGKDTLEKEPVPVLVQAALPLQLLIISSSPDFENTFLRNNLAQQGWPVSVITTVSSNKTDKQFLNVPAPQQAGKLTVSYLTKFDVLMADEEALQKISPAELAAIRTAVSEKGAGLVIKLDAQKNTGAFYSKYFPVKSIKKSEQLFLQLRSGITDSGRYKLKMTDPVSIGQVPGVQAILEDEQSNIYTAGTMYGSGKIIATLLQNTYSIALAGNTASYQQLWWLLLNRAARKIYPEETWQINPFMPFVNETVQVQVEKNDVLLPRAVAGKTNIYLKQNEWLPFQWQGKYWPTAAGWQPLPRLNVQTNDWYVYNANDWQPLTRYNRLLATKKYATLHAVPAEQPPGLQHTFLPVHRTLLMVIVFLCSCIFLWVEQKAGRKEVFILKKT